MNKRGWIRIVEAFIAILIIVGAVLILFNNEGLNRGVAAAEVYEIQSNLLREIQVNEDYREQILEPDRTIPVETDVLNAYSPLKDAKNPIKTSFPYGVENLVIERLEQYPQLSCIAKICELDDVCGLSTFPVENPDDVFASSVAIAASARLTTGDLSPRQLKLFCWFV